MMALALALNKTLADPSLNMSLHSALETVVFNGASVSECHGGDTCGTSAYFNSY